MAKGKRPVPSRTRKLSPSAPMVLRGGPRGRVGRRRTSSSMGDHFGGPPSTFLREDCKQCRKASVRTRASHVPVPNDPVVPAAVPAQRTSAAAPMVEPPVPPAAGPRAAVADGRPPAISAPDGRVSVRAASGPGAQLATPAVSGRPRAGVPARAVAAEQIVVALPTGVPPAEGALPLGAVPLVGGRLVPVVSVRLIGGRTIGAVLLVAGPPGPGVSVRRLGALPVVPAEPARRAHGPQALAVRGQPADAAPGRPVAAATPVGSVLTGLPIGVPPAERAGPAVRTPRVPLGEGAPQVATVPPIGGGPERVAEGARRLSGVGVSAPGAPATTGRSERRPARGWTGPPRCRRRGRSRGRLRAVARRGWHHRRRCPVRSATRRRGFAGRWWRTSRQRQAVACRRRRGRTPERCGTGRRRVAWRRG